MAPHDTTGTTTGGGGTGQGATGDPTCATPPCTAAGLNDVGTTTVAGTDERTGLTLNVGENIYGPFEAGFSSQQDGILEGMGCSDGSLGHVTGGIDTSTAEAMVAYGCSITLPRIDGDTYVSLLDECGGHTSDYHFHERLSCLYTESGTHSTQVGEGLDGKFIYGIYVF